jgi:hypothetical protein
METAPRGKARKFTDQQLRDALQAGITPADFARQVGCSRQAVNLRVKQLELTTAAAAVAPLESQRFIRHNLGVMEQLSKNLVRANLLMDACDEWLRDAEDESRYNLEARSGEIDVTYKVEVRTDNGYRTLKRKKKLDELLGLLEGTDDDGARFVGVEKGEYKHADPRELILKTQAETRQTAGLIIEAMQRVTNARIMDEFRQACVEEIGKESPDCAQRIAERLQRAIVLHAAFAGPGALPDRSGEPN